jgi:hypothetical protein
MSLKGLPSLTVVGINHAATLALVLNYGFWHCARAGPPFIHYLTVATIHHAATLKV